MGGTPPTPPSVVMPAPTAPSLFSSVIPEADYAAAGEYLKRIQEQTQKAVEERIAQTGTPEEIGARQAGQRFQEAASYRASLPKGDTYLKAITGRSGMQGDMWTGVKEATEQRVSDAAKAYGEALGKVSEAKAKPKEPVTFETPSWAKPQERQAPVTTVLEPPKPKTEETKPADSGLTSEEREGLRAYRQSLLNAEYNQNYPPG